MLHEPPSRDSPFIACFLPLLRLPKTGLSRACLLPCLQWGLAKQKWYPLTLPACHAICVLAEFQSNVPNERGAALTSLCCSWSPRQTSGLTHAWSACYGVMHVDGASPMWCRTNNISCERLQASQWHPGTLTPSVTTAEHARVGNITLIMTV